MKAKIKQFRFSQRGSILVLVLVSLIILGALGLGMLSVAYGVRHRAIMLRNEAVAMLAAEAGYEKAISWMSQQDDMLSALKDGAPGMSDSLEFVDGDCDYRIELFAFIGARPIYRVISNGHSGTFNRTVDVLVVQAVSGWDMGACRVLFGGTTTYPVSFADDEIIDLPIQINKLDDNPDNRDIYIKGDPRFLQSVTMGESRYRTGSSSDKYGSVMDLFEDGIYFEQPDCKVTDEASVQSKVDRFEESSDSQFRFTPVAGAPVLNPHPAVQLEFFVEGGVGKVRITNNCTVRGYQRDQNFKTLDFKITPGSDGKQSERYDIYAYHFMPEDAEEAGARFTRPIDDTYVSQSIGGVESEPGGQIFVDGSVIIGGDKSSHNGDQVVKGKITVVATGNIWLADSVVVDGPHDGDGKPTTDNPNILGLLAQGVVKVIDPGISGYDAGDKNNYPGPPDVNLVGFAYVPIGRDEGGEEYERHLPDPMVAEAAMTVGGGGWGAENVEWNGYGNRKEEPGSGSQNDLVVHGTISESSRGVVGLIGKDGFLKYYYMDERFLEGILPGDIWLRGKYIPAPAGWQDYRPSN